MTRTFSWAFQLGNMTHGNSPLVIDWKSPNGIKQLVLSRCVIVSISLSFRKYMFLSCQYSWLWNQLWLSFANTKTPYIFLKTSDPSDHLTHTAKNLWKQRRSVYPSCYQVGNFDLSKMVTNFYLSISSVWLMIGVCPSWAGKVPNFDIQDAKPAENLRDLLLVKRMK